MSGRDFSPHMAVISGIFLGLVPEIGSADLARTAVLAAVGAASSFAATLFLKWIAGGCKGIRRRR